MKILLAVHLFFPEHGAGTEVLTLELARALRARGHEAIIVACNRHDQSDNTAVPWISQYEYDSFRVFHLNYCVPRQGSQIGMHVNAPERVRLLKELVQDLSPDIVHFMHIQGFSAAAISEVKTLNIPVFFSATDYWALCPRANLYKPFNQTVCGGPADPADCIHCAQPKIPPALARIAVRLSRPGLANVCDKFALIESTRQRAGGMAAHINAANGIFVSTNFLAELLHKYGVRADLIKVIPYGVNLGEIPPRLAAPEEFSETAPLRLLFIGSLIQIKGAHVLIEALRHLTRLQRKSVEVRIYGKCAAENPDYCESLKRLALSTGAAVHFMGTFHHEDIGKVLRDAHACVVPSIWYESAPLVLCSALAVGIPVLVSKMGGMTEIINEGENGCSFEAGNPEKLAQLLARLLQAPMWFKRPPDAMPVAYRSPIEYGDDVEAQYLKICGTNL